MALLSRVIRGSNLPQTPLFKRHSEKVFFTFSYLHSVFWGASLCTLLSLDRILAFGPWGPSTREHPECSPAPATGSNGTIRQQTALGISTQSSTSCHLCSHHPPDPLTPCFPTVCTPFPAPSPHPAFELLPASQDVLHPPPRCPCPAPHSQPSHPPPSEKRIVLQLLKTSRGAVSTTSAGISF